MEQNLEEGTRFATAMKSAIAAKERGDDERCKYHLNTAKDARYSLKSTEITKNKAMLDKYKQMTESYEGFSTTLIESFTLMEGMIERDDFDDLVASRKKSAKVIDYKHSDKQAHITFVDGEGVKRTVKYTPTGKSMINHGPYEGGEQVADSKERVNKTTVKTVKRGRGRPRMDKFTEAVNAIMTLTEEEFDELMENYTLDELVHEILSED